MGVTKKDKEQRHGWLQKLVENSSFSGIFYTWIVLIVGFALLGFYLSMAGIAPMVSSSGPISDTIEGFTGALMHSASAATATGISGYSTSGTVGNLIFLLELMVGLVLYGIIIAKLVGYKQDTILDEIHEINYEEAFTNYRRGLSLVRADIVVIIEKIESDNLKHREVKDLWIIFSGLDQTLTNIKNLVMPQESGKVKSKRLESAKLELILSSMKLTMNKVAELIKALKSHGIDWRDELLLTSVYYDIQIVREILENEIRKTSDRKIIDKINSVKIVLDELEGDLKAPKKEELNTEEERPYHERIETDFPVHPPKPYRSDENSMHDESESQSEEYREPRVVEDMPEDKLYHEEDNQHHNEEEHDKDIYHHKKEHDEEKGHADPRLG
jgi:hypothetical protein